MIDLRIPDLSQGYKSPAQICRINTESWSCNNLYCLRCGNGNLLHEKNNTGVRDFYCPVCRAHYEQKSKNKVFSDLVADGDYQTLFTQVVNRSNPDFFFLNYRKIDPDISNAYFGVVTDLFVVPKHFFCPEMILPRNPLSEKARRAGWTGCNISLKNLPEEARIHIIRDECVVDKDLVLEHFRKTAFLEEETFNSRKWLLDVLHCVNLLSDSFTINDMYSFADFLAEKHPRNRNIKAKIRQQLQFLRDKNIIEFNSRGHYTKIAH